MTLCYLFSILVNTCLRFFQDCLRLDTIFSSVINIYSLQKGCFLLARVSGEFLMLAPIG
jgi:hypothetical protein